MKHRKEITNNIGSDLYSMQVYDPSFDFNHFNPNAFFTKWAATEVSNFNNIPAGMETYTLAGGLYAVFIHRGDAGTAAKTFGYIFGTWLPASDYVLDQRPHFEILGEKYKNNDPGSEEEVWIPVKKKE
jgi:AraC family transcriptional regulator